MNIRHILLLITLFAVTSATASDNTTADYRLNVQPFSELTIIDGISVEYICHTDSAGWAVFSCTPAKASQIIFTNNADHLTVRTAAEEEPIEGMPKVKVYSQALRKVENSGDSLVTVRLSSPIESFKAKQIGNGTLVIENIDSRTVEAGITAGNGSLRISGKTGKAKLSNVSTGTVDASELKADNVNSFIFGTGDIRCTAANNLRIYGAGSGKVRYSGTPDKVSNRGLGVKAVTDTTATSTAEEPK